MRPDVTSRLAGSCLLLALVFWAGAASAQDEPGLGGKPAATRPTGPASPASPAAAARQNALRVALETAERSCRAAEPCPLIPRVLRALGTPRLAARAARLLARLGDARAVAPLGFLARYGATAKLRATAQRALQKLAATPAAQAALERLRRDDPDPELRRVAAQALGSRAPSGVGQASVRMRPDGSADPQRPPVDDMRASDPSRMIFGTTALSRGAKKVYWTAYQIGVHFVDYAVSEHVEFGLGTALPVGIYGLMPRLKLLLHPTPKVHLGLQFTGGIFGTFIEGNVGFGAYTGGPVLSFGDEKLSFSTSFLFGGRSTYGDDGYRDDDNTRWIALGNAGVSWRLNRRVRLGLEVNVPLHQGFELNGKFWVLMYGVRIFGEHIYGDINMVVPLFDGVEDVLRYMPLGVPFLVFGYKI